jgi:hypothetical protein
MKKNLGALATLVILFYFGDFLLINEKKKLEVPMIQKKYFGKILFKSPHFKNRYQHVTKI